MNEDMRELLGEEIKAEIEALASLEPGSQEKGGAVDDIAKLYKLYIEDLKLDADYDLKSASQTIEEKKNKAELEFRQAQAEVETDLQERDIRIKEEQLREDIKNHYIRLGVEVAGLVLPLMFYGAWMRRGFKFEETGSFTSTTFRGLFNRFRPTGK